MRCAGDGFDTKRDNCDTACEISGRVCSAIQSKDPTRDGYDFAETAVTSVVDCDIVSLLIGVSVVSGMFDIRNVFGTAGV